MTPRGIKLVTAAVLLCCTGTPHAQCTFPNQPLRIIAAFPAGGPTPFAGTPDRRARLDAGGSAPFSMPSDETAASIRNEAVKWQMVVKAINIRIE